MQTSQEELKSTNEELQSTNEELQSTNEELTTSKEEMQSLNEELQTVNAELQSKVDDFSRVNNDMKNLLNSTDIATLFLDKELNIRRFTNQATKIFKLIKSDIGRPFTDQVSDLIYPDVATDALEVLRTLVFIEKKIPTKDGRWFTIRIMPYRTFDDRIDGLVITFINRSDLKQVEIKLNETDQMTRFLLNSSSDRIIKLSNELKILEFNPEAEIFFGKKREDTVNQDFIQLFVSLAAQNKTENCLKKLMDKSLDGKIKLQLIIAGGIEPIVEWTVNVHLDNQKKATGITLITKKTEL
jgi:two-component system CheB/CheR fusion protein